MHWCSKSPTGHLLGLRRGSRWNKIICLLWALSKKCTEFICFTFVQTSLQPLSSSSHLFLCQQEKGQLQPYALHSPPGVLAFLFSSARTIPHEYVQASLFQFLPSLSNTHMWFKFHYTFNKISNTSRNIKYRGNVPYLSVNLWFRSPGLGFKSTRNLKFWFWSSWEDRTTSWTVPGGESRCVHPRLFHQVQGP